ncbi:hypothetical protein NQ318_005638 [Aromia moschata]|uniref:Uncharacterized protein n=1 Tax=Aromia moschata TaxID=1265417 RepID=A0AAV8XYT4_9CUCU|nr:hypothetical protein NQ318_005638 [Aromia moschata]
MFLIKKKWKKKPKLDNDIDALWGDDLDENALEDCIKLATQVCEEDIVTCTQLNNVTILPTYSAFKERSSIISSTQVFDSRQPSTSTVKAVTKTKAVGEGSEKEIKLLREQYEEKIGEVAVLRAQIQETKINIQLEQQKTQNEWKQKLSTSERQIKSIKKIANLKQKILDVTKRTNLNASLNATQNTTNQKNKADQLIVNQIKMDKSKTKIQVIIHPVYPLKEIIKNSVFNIPKQQQHVIKKKLTYPCRNAIPYLQNQTIFATIAVDKSVISIKSIYPEILNLMYCTQDELNSDERINSINKIICTCEQFIEDLQNFLDQIKHNLRREDILEADTNYLKYQELLEKEEIGMKAATLLNFLSKLFPYCDYLKGYGCKNRELNFEDRESYTKKISLSREQTTARKAKVMSSFICSTLQLLVNIVKSRNFDYEIILSRPPIDVICDITLLFKVASQHSSFVEYLFNKSSNSITSKKGVLYFNEDVCRFYVFVMLFDNSVFKLNGEYFSLSVCLNMLCFIYNTFQTSSWIHHRDAKECECVPQLYKLEIEIVFIALKMYVEEIKQSKKKTSDWKYFFKNPITVKVLSLMTFNSYELTEKYITAFSQKKTLEKLNISEEVTDIPSNAFAKLDF